MQAATVYNSLLNVLIATYRTYKSAENLSKAINGLITSYRENSCIKSVITSCTFQQFT